MIPQEFCEVKNVFRLPRLPLEGRIDLTYRCNNNCRHCWLRIPSDAPEAKDELSFEEIKRIASDAQKMGCHKWGISGGEPMLRPDFIEIFDYLTRNSPSYFLNTNGTLITPKIARLMKRKGVKMVSLYGANSEVHDRITRRPGSFAETMRGFSYLKEAGAGFIVQIIPMRDNYHQYQETIKLAESLSKHWRIGSAWLHLSACGDAQVNKEILRQRLTPKEILEFDKPAVPDTDRGEKANHHCPSGNRDDYLFSSCIKSGREAHIDPYAKMSFCCFIKEAGLRYDLRKGNFRDGWEKFIPSLAAKIRITEEYSRNCGSCGLRKNCRSCPAYAYLEHHRFSAKIDYLCEIARENERFKEDWRKNHRRYYRIADITLQMDSDLPITDSTFRSKFRLFEVGAPGEDTVCLRHHFFLPDLADKELGKEIYRKEPWAIYKRNGSWVYLGISFAQGNNEQLRQAAVFNSGHTIGRIYNTRPDVFSKGNLSSLTLFPTDQILLARILADRQGCFLHSCGVNFNGRGLLFVGRSEVGKSTIAAMLKGRAEILCDDRIIVRDTQGGLKIYGTWSHGDVSEVSCGSAPLNAIMFLEKAKENRLIPLADKKEIIKRILSCVIRPVVTVDWWEKTLALVEKIPDRSPSYILKFDKSGEIIKLLEKICAARNGLL